MNFESTFLRVLIGVQYFFLIPTKEHLSKSLEKSCDTVYGQVFHIRNKISGVF